ncbi:coenzyme F430 synthase [Methanosalsum natronophilum]|nr:coenzyme F430 synthase [Methanosalsum natronophilum]MCS3923056.1 UDP-N-acetylmuramyl pentapeptide synthase [Methanosalsum natronophilum]
MCNKEKNVVVLDLTHGGIIITKKLASIGYNVIAIDVYKTVKQDILDELNCNDKIYATKKAPILKDIDFIAAPVHLDPFNEILKFAEKESLRILSHHQVVAKILESYPWLDRSKIIEVTGTKAKTSTVSLLAEMVSANKGILLLSSRGLEYWYQGVPELLKKGLSITPGSILESLDKCQEKNLKPDLYIFECSIGVTGYNYLSILTTLDADYSIANGFKKASDAKLQIIENASRKDKSILLLNSSDRKAIQHSKYTNNKNQELVIFSSKQYCDADYNIYNSNMTLFVKYNDHKISFPLKNNTYLSSYQIAISSSITASLILGVPNNSIANVIYKFSGIEGRMKIHKINNRIIIDNSNSGLTFNLIQKALDTTLKTYHNKNIYMLLGEEKKQVCEGLNPNEVDRFINKNINKITKMILVGTRMEHIEHENIFYAPCREEGLVKAYDASNPGDVVLSCVKCFR